MPVIYTTAKGVEIEVLPGKKSRYDFIVKYREPGKRWRTPKHIHLIVDLFAKRGGNPTLTNLLLDHIINNLIMQVHPSTTFPPSLQIFSPSHIYPFSDLEQYGEYSIEFLLVIVELIMIQEKTNYPDGDLNLRLFQMLRDGADIFSIVSMATFR
ncbi:MAG: hypothetical protein D6784_02660 [Chloroflexi bacterium]|nr:MAG: hypothetical protein D6784_02660 [Chloroflexota bacterium]